MPSGCGRPLARLGVSERVELTGSVGDVPALLRDHDALLFCSSQGADVTPLVLMEALVEERPVVAADVGSVAEVLREGECGSVVPRRGSRSDGGRGDRLWSPIRRRRGRRRGAAPSGCDATTTAQPGSTGSGTRSSPRSSCSQAAHKFPRLSSVSQTITPVTPWPKSTARTA